MTKTRIFTFMPYNDYYTWWQHHKHTYIFIYTIQRLLYPMEAWQTHAYLHLYHTTTTIPDGSMTITGIFIFIPYNDYYTRWQHDKHTYIYIYTIQRLLYPMASCQTHVYLHLYRTTTTIPDGSMTNTRIFTFIPYNDYNTRWKHDKHTHIYMYTIQRLQYPMEAWQTHVYLHVYHTATTIPDGSMTNTRIFTCIPYNDYNTRWKHDKHTHIYIYTIQRIQYPVEAWQSHVYLHLYHTTTTIPDGSKTNTRIFTFIPYNDCIIPDGSMTNTRIFTFIPYNDYYTRWRHDKNMYIYIYTVQRLLYPMAAWQTHVYFHLYHTTTTIPDGSMTNTRIFTFIPYNDYNTRWKHDNHTYIYIYTIQRLHYTRWQHHKHTFIYIYTIQRLLYPMEAWQTHVYLHLYRTTTIIPDGSMTNTRIFTFIPYNDYNNRWKHDKHTHIYIYTIQRLLYPMEAWQIHVYLDLYHTTTTIPDGSMTNTRIFTFIPYNEYNTRWKHDNHTYIYIYTTQRLQYPMEARQTHVYLHLYHTTTAIHRWKHDKHTYIYIYTIQRLLYPMEAWQTYVYLHLYHTTTIIPDGSMTNTRIFTFIPYNDYNTRWKHDKHTYIYIYTIQRLQYPMEAWETHVYFTFIPYNDCNTRWKHDKHTYIYIYTIQRLQYPMEAWQTHVYLHLYHTTTAIPDGSMTITRIFTFIPNTRVQLRWIFHDTHTYIYIYIPNTRLLYPYDLHLQTHVYLHLYHTTTIIPDGSIHKYTRIFTFIPYNDYYIRNTRVYLHLYQTNPTYNARWKHSTTRAYLHIYSKHTTYMYPMEAWQTHVYLHLYHTHDYNTRWKHDKHTYIYIYTIQRLQYPMEAWQTHVYLHLYHTTTIYTRWKHDKHTYIYIYTIQRIQYPMEAWQTHVYLHLYSIQRRVYYIYMPKTRTFSFMFQTHDYYTRWKHDKHTRTFTFIFHTTTRIFTWWHLSFKHMRIFTFIPYNDYYTRWKHDKHTYIYIYTIQRLQYPMEAWQSQVYLYLYHTTTIPTPMAAWRIFTFIPYNDYYTRWIFMTNTRIFTFIPYNDYNTRWKHDKHTYIYIYTIQRLQYPMEAWQTHVYLHLYHTTTTIPDGSMTNTRIFTFIPYNDYNTRWKHDKHTYIYIYTYNDYYTR